MPVLKTCEHFQVSPENTVLVGDSSTDAKAAHAAGVTLFCVPYGYRNQPVESFNPHHIIQSIADIPGLLKSQA
jgi:phosphoglycolate phosphatase